MRTILQKFLSAVLVASVPMAIHAQTPPQNSPYFTDQEYTFNEDNTSQAFRLVGIVACYIKMMAPEKAFNVVGPSPYVAMVNPELCDSNEGAATDSSGNAKVNVVLEASVIESNLLADGTLRAKIWLNSIYDDAGVGAKRLYIDARIVGGPTKKPPYGEWEVNWCALIPGEDTGTAEPTCYEKGFARVDASGGRAFYENQELEGAETVNKTMAVVGNIASDEKSGGGKYSFAANSNVTPSQNTSSRSGTYAFVNAGTNAQFLYGDFLEDGVAAQVCRIPSSEATGAYTNTWETWLYNPTTGNRVDRNSGFSVRDASGAWAWAGYWGLHMNRTTGPVAGEVLTRYNSNDQVVGRYTVFTAPGKLKKITTSSKTLANLQNLTFNWNVNRKDLTGDINHDGTWVSAKTLWNGSRFVVSGYDLCTNSCAFQPLTNTSFSIADLQARTNSIWGWFDGTGQNFEILLAVWTPSGNNWTLTQFTNPSEIDVFIRSEVVVAPGDNTVPQTLHCVGRCVGVVNGSLQEFGEGDVLTPRVYTWDSASGTMLSGSTPINFSSRANGHFSGALVSSADLPSIQCQVQGANGYCESKVNRANITHYRWETGRDAWNQFSGVKDESGAVVTFEAPLAVNHTVVDPKAGAYLGKTVGIQYPGDGQLWTPGFCFDPVTLARSNDCNGNDTQWAQEFTIPTNLNTGFVTDADGNRYLVKHLKKGIFFPNSGQMSDCNPLVPIAAEYSTVALPTRADWKNPANPSSSTYIGAYQSPDGRRVLIINGELQN